MEMRQFFGHEISRLGFGLMRLPREAGGGMGAEIDFALASSLVDQAIASGVNYFDTAYGYRGSEAFAGQALSKYPRDSYFLATKCPAGMAKTQEEFDKVFAESLERCQTEYFDFYMVHNVAQGSSGANASQDYFDTFKNQGMYEMLLKKKEEGKIRQVGFSFHGTIELLKLMLDGFKWDFVQIQLNYMDWTGTDAKAQYELLTEYQIPVIVMEPLRGGALADLPEESAKILKEAKPDASLASWGIRFAASLPNVMTVLSGMNAVDQVTDNIETMQEFQAITEEEKGLLEKVVALYNQAGAIPCTGCAYCMPCPYDVNIPRVFSIYNHFKIVNNRIAFSNGYNSLGAKADASACQQCSACVEKCPQHIAIPEFMTEINDFANTPPGPPPGAPAPGRA